MKDLLPRHANLGSDLQWSHTKFDVVVSICNPSRGKVETGSLELTLSQPCQIGELLVQ